MQNISINNGDGSTATSIDLGAAPYSITSDTLVEVSAGSAGASTHAFNTVVAGDISITLPLAANAPGALLVIPVKTHLSTWTSGNRPANANYVFYAPASGDAIVGQTSNYAFLNSTSYDINTLVLVSNGANGWYVASNR